MGPAATLTLWATAIVAAAGALTVLGKTALWLWRRARQAGHLLDDLLGEPAHGDQPARPSAMARLGAIEAELRPNHGGSLRDAVDRVGQGLADHLAEHRADTTT